MNDATPPIAPMIEVRSLTKSYDGGLVQALRGVDLDVAPGEVLALMGPSGCGKTTLLSVISSLEPATGGEVRVAGRPLAEHAPHWRFRAEWIGFLFQFHHLLAHLTLLENVLLAMGPAQGARSRRKARAAELLEQVGLGGKAGAFPNRISGGERQRAALARALASDPRIMLADEPTGSVDTDTGQAIMEFVLAGCRESGCTCLVATHNPEIAAMADRVVHMRNGVLVA